MIRFVALIGAIVLGLLVVCGVTDPTDAERAISGTQALIALAILAKDQGLA